MSLSAGGHLSLLLAYLGQLPQISAVMTLYAPVELRAQQLMSKSYESSIYDMIHSFFLLSRLNELCEGVSNNTHCIEQLSPMAWVNRKDLPPTLIIHGESDSIVPIMHARMLKAQLDTVGVKNSYLEIPCETHSCEERTSCACKLSTA